jgi:hypothetical protein
VVTELSSRLLIPLATESSGEGVRGESADIACHLGFDALRKSKLREGSLHPWVLAWVSSVKVEGNND